MLPAAGRVGCEGFAPRIDVDDDQGVDIEEHGRFATGSRGPSARCGRDARAPGRASPDDSGTMPRRVRITEAVR